MPRKPPTVQGTKRPEQRPNAYRRGYNRQWAKSRKAFLSRHPFCRRCEAMGTLRPATVVDHIVPHKADQTLFWDMTNWQPLCKACHDQKTGAGL